MKNRKEKRAKGKGKNNTPALTSLASLWPSHVIFGDTKYMGDTGHIYLCTGRKENEPLSTARYQLMKGEREKA